MKRESGRTYNMSDADLCMFTSNLVGFITRDTIEFAAKGVSALDVTAMEALGDAFEIFPNDAFYKSDVTVSVVAKNASRESNQIQMRAIIGCAKIKWGTAAAQVKRFDAGKMTVDSDRSFLTLARQCVTLATEFLLDLTAEGLTQAMIDALTAEAQTMENELNNISEKEALRDLKTQERIEKGNELYGFVARYCEIGKILWQDVDEAKYNDYVVYHSAPGVPSKVQNMDYDLPTTTISWSAASGATDYQLERKFSTDPDWTVTFEGANLSVLDVLTTGAWLYRCRGQNTEGYGAWSDELIVIIPI